MLLLYGIFWVSLFKQTFSGIIPEKLEPVRVSHELKMPLLGFGTAALGDKGKETICYAIAAGFRLFDTAQAKEWYQEVDMGAAIADCWKDRSVDDLVIVTKVHPRSFQYDQMKLDLEASQNYIYGKNRTLDVVLLHAPYCWWTECTEEDKNNSWQVAWSNLEKFQSAGMIDAIGVSNFNEQQLQDLILIANKRVAVVQNWMDPFHQDVDVREFCKQHNIIYMAYSSLGTQWGWKTMENPVLSNEVLQKIAKKHDKSIALVVQSWVIQEGVVAIPRTTNEAHITENARLLGVTPIEPLLVFLDEDDMKSIRALDGTMYDNHGDIDYVEEEDQFQSDVVGVDEPYEAPPAAETNEPGPYTTEPETNEPEPVAQQIEHVPQKVETENEAQDDDEPQETPP
eukprot:gene7771-15902_t